MVLEERRQSSTPRASVAEILETLQLKADELHDGDLQNHILDLFHALPVGHQMTFLRRSLVLQWESQLRIAKASFCDIYMEEEKMYIRRDDITKEREDSNLLSDPGRLSKSSKWFGWILITVSLVASLLMFFFIYKEGEFGFKGSLAEEVSHLYDVFQAVMED